MEILFDQSDVLRALLGGGLIGLSASILLIFNGRIAGISGIFFGLFQGPSEQKNWRLVFVLGLLCGGVISILLLPDPFSSRVQTSFWQVIVAGFLVGFGTRMGSGCTSGHGVCGISRLSPRSMIATIVFITSGILTCWLVGGV
ncbi:MAG: YeeE/YedE family protein [Pseudomonadota bacterium]